MSYVDTEEVGDSLSEDATETTADDRAPREVTPDPAPQRPDASPAVPQPPDVRLQPTDAPTDQPTDAPAAPQPAPVDPPVESGAAAWPAAGAPVSPSPAPPRRSRALVVITILLAVALVAAVAAGVWLFLQLERASERIDEQRELIDKKQAFAAAVHDLEASTEPMHGLPFGSIVPWDRYEQLAADGWEHRWDAAAMDADILRVQRAEQEMKALQSTAALEIATNASGTAWEATLDQLGKGFVSTRIDDAAASCEAEALGCVFGEEPFMVHLDAASGSDPMMTDWMRTGVAYHEFAHVLQFTNPQPTADAVTAFGGDMETMADCYALTFLDGWTLEHEVWTTPYEGWEVSVGYGYVCDEAQRQVIRDWVAKLGVEPRELHIGPA